jgi:hypothetical protein
MDIAIGCCGIYLMLHGHFFIGAFLVIAGFVVGGMG